MSSMPFDDEYEKRRAKAYRDYDIIRKQFPVLVEKTAALDPPKKKTRRSAKKRKTEAEKKTGDPPAPALTPEIRARYKELAGIIKGFLKELGDDVDEAAAGGSTSQAAPPPPAAAGDKQ
ncbi:hypothetical protein SETIT_1G241700v2 [Setaria italica]|uniref:Uncharacterized protein n=1 Tax=Setaria italica TaxID=4555 RepID=A0A368PNT2_SETIT|nr:uncharacterized protein LOC101752617 [Setaria italica]RCV07405.1 hypothetical protein SETIT_1G241700v2 [Setaria italica]